MTTVTAADRVLAWNIRLLECPPKNDRVAGTFQPCKPYRPFLTWQHLFDDLFLCFDLDYTPTLEVGALALWFRAGPRDPTILLPDGQLAPCVYLDHPSSRSYNSGNVLAQHINVETRAERGVEGKNTSGTDEDDTEELDPPPLDLTLVVHDGDGCSTRSAELESHLDNGCAMPIPLKRNANFKFLPIPTQAGNSTMPTSPQTPKSSSRGSPTKRPRIDPSGARSGSSSPTKRDPILRTKMQAPPELEVNVKKLYNGTCVITGNNTAWGRKGRPSMISGPGIVACHIVPKAMHRWFPLLDKENPTEQDRWNAVNSTSNCMVMDSVAHSIFDNRLLAVHPSSHRIRLFAPVEPLLRRNQRKALFGRNPPSTTSLEWHYKMAVVENMCALMLDADGGAKRVPWREGPLPILGDTEEGASDIHDVDRGRAAWQARGSDEPTGQPYCGQQDAPDAVDNACPPPMTTSGSSGSTPLSSTMVSSFSEGVLQSYDGKKRKLVLLTSDLDDQHYSSSLDLEELRRRLGDEAAHRNDVSALNRWIAKRQPLRSRHTD